MATDGDVQVPDVILANAVYQESAVTSPTPPNPHVPAWTTDGSLPQDRGHRNTSKSEGAMHVPFHVCGTHGEIFESGNGRS